ncbi:acyl-CoA reductase [Clostridium sp. SHJSY1]|uniref:acyl-CoA reductase n=1 Tax=Clostridium sp. SHJSY1 TaxID=2942483 RepID=UPI0028770ADE|nr:acyl-CoA reductase [Clostridium sp. SHJSY1]MDS0527882.1 acyl-CoA reductase [Clostridium sp. SHJSY1]
MINCFMLGDKFFQKPKKFSSLNFIIDELEKNREQIYFYPLDVIVEIINQYSQILLKNRELLNYEGVSYLALWMKKSNINKLLSIDIENRDYLDDFVKIENNKFMKAQPRGVICHFMAGNVPTLSIYYAIQALLCKNLNLIRVPIQNIAIVAELLKPLQHITVNFNGKEYSGIVLLKSISLVNFPSDNIELNREMSQVADVRVICGGEEAVNSLTILPKKTTCKDIIFGPKYSFAVFEKSAIDSSNLSKTLDFFARDIVTFHQKACSSPQVLFVEKSDMDIKLLAKALSESLMKLSKIYPNDQISQCASAKIINKRGEYLLSLDKDIICDTGLQYTILMNNDINLEEPIHYRTIFIKEVDDIFQICNLITPRIQTIGIASENQSKFREFANKVSLKGVDRIVKVGCMNIYDSPWDGIFFMREIVKWTTLTLD